MYYTRPALPQLGLDLVKVRGGGSVPSQFWGRTTDNRPVYIRYRGGGLSVQIGAIGAPEDEAKQILLNSMIAPWPHGVILLEQVCDLLGMTICGERPLLSEDKLRSAAEEEDVLDWSGRTTYWRRSLCLAESDGPSLAEAIVHLAPSPRLFGFAFEAAGTSSPRRRCVLRDDVHKAPFIGFGVDAAAFERILTRDHVSLAEVRQAFALIVNLSIGDDFPKSQLSTAAISKFLGREIELAGGTSGHVYTRFATGNSQSEQLVQQIAAIVDERFTNVLETVDLTSGFILGNTREAWYSRALADWCQAAPDRYLGVSGDPLTGEKHGTRPFRP